MIPLGTLLSLAGTPSLSADSPTAVAAVLIGVLVVLLVEQEVLRVIHGTTVGPATRVLSIAVAPLLIAFVVVVAVQLATILG